MWYCKCSCGQVMGWHRWPKHPVVTLCANLMFSLACGRKSLRDWGTCNHLSQDSNPSTLSVCAECFQSVQTPRWGCQLVKSLLCVTRKIRSAAFMQGPVLCLLDCFIPFTCPQPLSSRYRLMSYTRFPPYILCQSFPCHLLDCCVLAKVLSLFVLCYFL